jgi:hypothetical protein
MDELRRLFRGVDAEAPHGDAVVAAAREGNQS